LAVGCRRVLIQGAGDFSQLIELHLVWDGATNTELEGVPVGLHATDATVVRLAPGASTTTVRAENGASVTLHADVPRRAHAALLELSLGPNGYRLLGLRDDPLARILNDPLYLFSPLIVARATYRISDTTRVVSLNALNLNRRWDADLGLYLNYETLRALDRRFAVNLLIGGHAVAFTTPGGYYVRFGAPQGAELVVYDAFLRNHNLTLGGFVYPSIAGESYYNVSLRYGTPGLFFEANFLHWQEPLPNGTPASTRSAAITVGMPILHFL
jgi:hypothetical protein